VAAFILDFPASGLVVTADLVSVFLGPAFWQVAVTLGCLDPTVTGWGGVFRLGGGVVLALMTRPLGVRDSTPRPSPSARQRARMAEISERRGGAVSATLMRLLC
jgi:hypothetical protein